MTSLDEKLVEQILLEVGAKPKYFGSMDVDFPLFKAELNPPSSDSPEPVFGKLFTKKKFVLLKNDVDYIAKHSAFFLYMQPFYQNSIPQVSKAKNKVLYNSLSVTVPPLNQLLAFPDKGNYVTATHKNISMDREVFQFSFEMSIGEFYREMITARMRQQ